MPEEEVQQGQPPEATGGVAQASPETQPQAQAPAAPAERPWQEVLDEIARTVPADEVRRHRLINDHAQSIAAKQRNEQIAKEREATRKYNDAYEFTQRFQALPDSQKVQHLSNPETAQRYADSMRVLQAGSASAATKEAALMEIREELESAVRGDEDFKAVSREALDEALASETPGRALHRLAQIALEEERKTMRKELMAEVDAKITSAMQKLHATAPEADMPVGAAVGGNGAMPSPQEYAAMPFEAREKARASGDVDKWTRAWAGRQ